MYRYLKKIIIFLITLIVLVFFTLTIINTKNNLDVKSNQIEFLENSLNKKKSQIKNIHSKLISKNINLEDLVFSEGIIFAKRSDKKLKIFSKQFILSEYSSDDIIFAKHPSASSSAYLEKYKDHIFLITATGQITFSDIQNLEIEKFKMKTIRSNIKEIINYSDFYTSSPFGIKDVLIDDDKIYISYVNELKKDCFNKGILAADINYKFLDFYKFFNNDEFIKKNDKFFETNKNDKLVPHQAGGRMISINNNVILTVGEYRLRILAQDENSYFGKIISINKLSGKYKILSKGHRNPQGLYFNKQTNQLLSTEHGPSGGDEINVINLHNKDKILNYGWPVASYGNHYFEEKNDNRLELSPLKKSHKENGFIEPIKYFVPSVGISQIIGIPNDFFETKSQQFIVGTMGTAKKLKDGMLSLYVFEYDDNDNKILKDVLIPIKSRVRDIIYLSKDKLVIMFLETNSTIGILKKG